MRIFLFLFMLFLTAGIFAQGDTPQQLEIDGEIVSVTYTETDTILVADLEDISVSSPRHFSDPQEYKRYRKYRRYAAIVYPYAVDAIKIFREVEYATNNMKKRKRKKHIKKLQKRLKKEFSEPIKKLSKTQGLILIKMIERELDTPFYQLVKGLRGGMTATYWSTMGRMYGYRLKEGYHKGNDYILDAVLEDFDISYEITTPDISR